MNISAEEIASVIDHTVLSPDSPGSAFEEACRFAVLHGCASVCVCPFAVKVCAAALAGARVRTCTVIGFPHGTSASDAKTAEAAIAIEHGADELDMVVNISKVIDRDWKYVERDIAGVTNTARNAGRIIKVIFENCFLDNSMKIELCRICTALGCDYVKTSTGFGTGGARLDDIRLMKENVGPEVKIKAAGGLRTLKDVTAALEAGASRIGCSRTAAVLAEII